MNSNNKYICNGELVSLDKLAHIIKPNEIINNIPATESIKLIKLIKQYQLVKDINCMVTDNGFVMYSVKNM